MRFTFKGGIHPPGFKKLTNTKAIIRAGVPKQVVVPLSQHIGAVCEPVVSVGEAVKIGTLIGRSDKFISAYVHSSVSGKVIKIESRAHPVLGACNSIVIESGQSQDAAYVNNHNCDIDMLSQEEIINSISQAGIVGLGGACFPTHVKLSPPKNKTIDTFILNCAECEPYLSCDHRVMLEHPEAVVKGAFGMMKALGVKNGIIAIEDNKPDAIKVMRSNAANFKIAVLKTKYPQGAEKQIINAVLGRIVPSGALPMDVGCVVQNVQTAFAVYEAVYLKKPLTERVITIAGPCVKNAVNIRVKIGTLVSDLMDSLGGFIREPKKVIFGGPMMGIAQYTLDVPVIKGTSGIIFLSEKETGNEQESACIRCGKCVDACPVKLLPTTLMHLVKKDRFSEAKDLGLANCYECGSCAYECPAKIPLLDYMKFGKAKI